MPVSLAKDSIDLGIVTKDAAPMLAFYQDVLGFTLHSKAERPGSTMHRLMCGTSMVKIVQHDKEPPTEAASGGLQGGTGYRYWTITVDNLDEIVAACEVAGYKVAVPALEIQAGVRISMVEDPDGNWVEFLQIDQL
jgi:glyoxylase I family protein